MVNITLVVIYPIATGKSRNEGYASVRKFDFWLRDDAAVFSKWQYAWGSWSMDVQLGGRDTHGYAYCTDDHHS